MTLGEKIGAIATRQDLIAFLGDFYTDYLANGHEWENPTLEHFLEAMPAWAVDHEQHAMHTGKDLDDQSPWQFMARLLFGATAYE